MADPLKIGKGIAGALAKVNQIAAAQREANLAKFLEPSKVQQRLYHGTGQGDIGAFKQPPSKKVPSGYMWGQKGDETYNRGVFLSPDPEMANHFAKRGTKLAEDDAGQYAVYPVRAQIERPFDYENPEHREMLAQFFQKQYDDWHKANPEAKRMPDVSMEHLLDNPGVNFQAIESPEMLHAIEKLGFDSFYTSEGRAKNIGVFDPRKIKSDIGNRGTYDITDPDINKAKGGVLHMADAGKVVKGAMSALNKLNEIANANKAAPKVDRLSMNYKDVTKRVPEVSEGLEKLLRGEITKAEYNDIVNMYKPVTPYSFVPKPATSEEAIGALRGDAAKSRYGKQEEYEPGSKIGLRLDIPAYTGKGVWVNSIHDEVGKKVAYGPTASVKNANLGISQNESKRIAQGGAKAPYARIKGEWNPLSEEEAVRRAQEYLDHPEWKQIGMDPERHSYFYDRRTMEPITGAEEVIQIGPLVLGKNPKYGKIEDFDYATGGGVRHMAKAGRVGAAAEGIVGALTKLNEIAKARKAASESKMADVLESKTAPMTTPMGTGLPLMPREQGMYTPREQKDLPRMIGVDKARAEGKSPKYNERMQDLLDSPKARQKVNNLINKGKELNVQEWYGTEPLRQVAMDAGRSPEQFESLMAQLASASQRNPVDKQNQMGSYLYHLSETGQLPENSLLLTNKLKKALKEDPSLAEGRQLVELPKGYGSLAQGDIFNRAVQIGQGDILGALPPNKKLGTFYENLLGNLKPVTVDVNALRGPIIEQGDPRWLTSKLVEKDETGKVINSYKPREMYDTGEMTMREAQQRPGFWEAAPSGSEYAGFEDLWQRGAKRHGVEPAEAQALGWYGSADVTALKTKPENYVDNLERLIKRTAEQTGKSPTEVMNDMVTGKGFLRKEGGAIAKPSWHVAVEKHMKDGGYTMVNEKHIPKVRSLKHLAKGGESKDDTASLKELYEALPDFYDQAIKPEVESYKKPRAFTDLMNRGVIANNPVSAVVDLTNFGLSGIDALTKGTRFPTRLSSDKPFGGSEQIKDLMKEYGMTTDEERPIAETVLGFMSPGSLVGGTIKGANAIKKAGAAMKDMAGSKKARGGLTLMR
jgi:hypothetical protein